MRKKQIIGLVMVFAFLVLSGFSLTIMVSGKKSDSGVRPLEEVALMDLTHENFNRKEANAQVEPLVSEPIVQPAVVGDVYPFDVSDDYLGIDYTENFVVAFEGEHILLLITKDAWLSWDGEYFHFANPIGDDSEPWLRSEDLISDDQLMYLMNEFDDNIYDTMAEIYGVPASRPSDDSLPDYEERDKIWTLIFNIRDLAYYDPAATSYIAGYFSLADSNHYQKNIMHIDTYDWADRTGPGVERPYLYEGTFAHEYEHMIHADIDPDEPSWTDEGLADLAGFLCGYGHPSGHIAYYFVYHEITPLTFWGNGLWDYGASYLFALYLYEKFGGAEFITALVHEQANGIKGIENTLAAFGYKKTFDEVYDAWIIANYVDDERKAGGKYGYELLDIGTEETWGYSLGYVLWAYWGAPYDVFPPYFGVPYLHSSWFFGDPQPYCANYYAFTNDKEVNLWLDGDDWAGNLAHSGTYEWYSGAEAWAWRSFNQSFYIPLGGATLEFYTYFEIEGDWDYGYVEVHDKDTGEWYTLDAAGTVNYVAHEQDNPNCPVGREPSDYSAVGRWHAFTGYSGGWLPVSMDLTPFADHTIEIYFTLWQDGAFTLQNMYVDDISIPEIGYIDGAEDGEDGWTSTGWFVTDGMFDNSWAVTVIDTKWVPMERYPISTNNAQKLHSVYNLLCDPVTEYGTISIGATPANSGRVRIAIISNRADHIISSGYWYGVE